MSQSQSSASLGPEPLGPDPGWAVILGASSGFGAAAARAFAAAGLDVLGVHLDRRATLALAEGVAKDVEAFGRRAVFVNTNAADPEKRDAVIERLRAEAGDDRPVRVLLHSIAFGTLRPLVAEDAKSAVRAPQIAMTLDVMATSLVGWVQALVEGGLFAEGGRVFAMTSEGGRRVIPSYGPVGVAKAALEAVVRQLALELAPHAITAPGIFATAGVSVTPAQIALAVI
nr:SDR family oxidoreductase [Myxococcota bacterium]